MNDRPVLDQINLVVGNMTAMLDFYRHLGLDIDEPPAPWDEHHRTAQSPEGIDFELDSSSFAPQWNRGWPGGQTGAVLGFRVRDRATVDQIYARLVGAGHAGQQPPYDAFWGARYALVTDPDGNSVGIMSGIDAARRTNPPSPT